MTMLTELSGILRGSWTTETFAQWDHVESPGPIGAFAIVVIVIQVLIALLLLGERWFKLMPHIRSLEADSKSKAADVLKGLQDTRDAYGDAIDAYSADLRRIRTAIEAANRGDDTGDELDNAREDACEKLGKSAFRAHIKFVEFSALYYRGDDNQLEDFLLDELCEDLDRFAAWVRFLNSPKLLKKITEKRSPMVITEKTTKPWYKVRLQLPEDRHSYVGDKLWEHLEPLLKAGEPGDQQ